MKSGAGKLKSVYSQDIMSVHMSGEHLGSMSNVRVSCPADLQTFETLFVPQHMSQRSILIYFLYQVEWYYDFRARLHV